MPNQSTASTHQPTHRLHRHGCPECANGWRQVVTVVPVLGDVPYEVMTWVECSARAIYRVSGEP